jgi:hypothetical protein
MRPVAIAAALLWALLAGPAGAQAPPVSVIAGEHRGFTRVVLQSRTAFDHVLEEVGADLRLTLPGRSIGLDPLRLFERIPRTRLGAARIEDGALVLTRACACPAEVVDLRPGLLVIDLRDGLPRDTAPGLPPASPAPVAPAGAARDAGLALALRLASDQGATASVPPAGGPEMLDDRLTEVSAHLSGEVARGLIEPAIVIGSTRAVGAPVALPGAPELPANIRLRPADQPVPALEPDPDPVTANCPDPALMAFLERDPSGDFGNRLADLRARLYREFDQPDPDVGAELVQHYLMWGLGAEARQLLDGSLTASAGRELLAGVADAIEGIASNRRARLARHAGCGGPAGLVAVLAAADDLPLPDGGRDLVTTFQTLPAPLRAVFGPAVVRRLVAAGTLDGARIVVGSIQRSADPDSALPALLSAEIERARGDVGRASASMAGLDPTDPGVLRLRLELGLARNQPLPAETLRDAIALAETDRAGHEGRLVAALVIRHHALAGAADEGLRLLDRYAGWLDRTPTATEDVADLRGALWAAAAQLPDAAFLELVVGRSDWRAASASDDALRAALAARFAGLGLSGLAQALGTAEPAAQRPDDRLTDRPGPGSPGDGDQGGSGPIPPGPGQVLAEGGTALPTAVPAPFALLIPDLPEPAQGRAGATTDALAPGVGGAVPADEPAGQAPAQDLPAPAPALLQRLDPMATGVRALEATEALRRELRELGLQGR